MRIVILTYESHQANLMTQRLLREFPGQVAGIVRSEVAIAGKSTWQSLWFLLTKTGLGFAGWKGVEIVLGRLAGLMLRLTGRKSAIPSLTQLSLDTGVPVVGAKQVNAPEILKIIRSWQPDLIISVYLNQLIRKKLIELAPWGVINVHGALLPKNRGLFPYFWALANGDNETGVTVHWVDPKFDTGAILVQEPLAITPADTIISLARKTAELGADLLVRAVKLIEAGDPPRLPQGEAEASYFSWPTAADVRRFTARSRKYGSLRAMWREMM
jgi:folate-dependent phosphoribosylglycinamide formyltransferase PurN